MWFTRFGEYINRSWKEAALSAVIFSCIPFMGWVSTVIMALITLRKGVQQGLIILCFSTMPILVLSLWGIGTLPVVIIVTGNLLTWILAGVLRESANWGRVLMTSIVLTVLTVFLLHLWMPNLGNDW